jgi:hypothetical protein
MSDRCNSRAKSAMAVGPVVACVPAGCENAMPRYVTWDDVPVAILENLEAGRRIGVVQLVCWISDERPGGLDADAASGVVLGILTRFSGRDRRARMLAVSDWPAYLAGVAQKAELQANEDARCLGHDHDENRLGSLVDPADCDRRVEAMEFLKILPTIHQSLTRAEQESFVDLMDDVLPGSARRRRRSSKVANHRAAGRRYRARVKVARLLFGADGAAWKRAAVTKKGS